jgi:hypothetical protein
VTSDRSDTTESSSSIYHLIQNPSNTINNINNNDSKITTTASDATDTFSHQQSEKKISFNETASDMSYRSDSDEHTDYNKQSNNQLYSIITDPSAEKNVDDVFWQRFDELEKESDDKLVDHQVLKESLVSSGKFYVGDAHYCIENMVKSGKIIQVGFHKYKRNTKENQALTSENRTDCKRKNERADSLNI